MLVSIENCRKLNNLLRTVVYYRYQRPFNETKFKLPHILEGFVVEWAYNVQCI